MISSVWTLADLNLCRYVLMVWQHLGSIVHFVHRCSNAVFTVPTDLHDSWLPLPYQRLVLSILLYGVVSKTDNPTTIISKIVCFNMTDYLITITSLACWILHCTIIIKYTCFMRIHIRKKFVGDPIHERLNIRAKELATSFCNRYSLTYKALAFYVASAASSPSELIRP